MGYESEDEEEENEILSPEKENALADAVSEISTRDEVDDDIYRKTLEDSSYMKSLMRKPSDKSLIGMLKKELAIRGAKKKLSERIQGVVNDKLFPEIMTQAFAIDGDVGLFLAMRVFMSSTEAERFVSDVKKASSDHKAEIHEVMNSLLERDDLKSKMDLKKIMGETMSHHKAFGAKLAMSAGPKIMSSLTKFF